MLRAVMLVVCWTSSVIASPSKPRPLQIVSTTSQKTYEHYIRQTNNQDLIALIPRMVFYGPNDMPRMFQIDEYSYTFTGAHHSPAGMYREPNPFFPWAHPGGLNDSTNATTFKFVVFPEPKDAVRSITEKIRYWRETIPSYQNTPLEGVFVWMFPVGTIFGEVLLVKNSKNEHWAFEVRVREKESEGLNKGWQMDSYRPFPNQRDLYTRALELAEKDQYKSDKKVAAFLEYLSVPRKLEVQTVADGFGGAAFKTRKAQYDYLPELPEAMVRELLETTPFQRSCGSYWTEAKENVPAMPTTRAAFHIVPRNSNLPVMHVDNEQCASCHDSTLKHATNFASSVGNNELWYGYVRGSDGILSFNPFAGGNGSKSFRRDLVDAGLMVESRVK